MKPYQNTQSKVAKVEGVAQSLESSQGNMEDDMILEDDLLPKPSGRVTGADGPELRSRRRAGPGVSVRKALGWRPSKAGFRIQSAAAGW